MTKAHSFITTDIKTPSDLAHAVSRAGHAPHFFTRETMRFFGDTMSNYGLRQPRDVRTSSGDIVRAYELYRRRPVKRGNQSSAWFCADTLRRVFPR